MNRKLIALVLLLGCLLSLTPEAYADREPLRTGWFEGPFNRESRTGIKSGYSYEYQQYLAQYTGWEYSYVKGTQAELLQTLSAGELDLLSALPYVESWDGSILYSAQPMGRERYFLYTDSKLSGIQPSDISTVNGKRIGVIPGSFQEDIVTDWARENGLTVELRRLSEMQQAHGLIASGFLDGVIAPEDLQDSRSLSRVFCVGDIPLYFGVNAGKPELKQALDTAMIRLTAERPLFSDELHARYLSASSAGHLTEEELTWLLGHGKIRVGYLRDNLAFSALDTDSGQVIGALAEYLKVAEDCLDNYTLSFEPVGYDSFQTQLEGLRKGEVDVIFPFGQNLYYAEEMGLLLSDEMLSAPVMAVSADPMFNESARNTVAVAGDNLSQKMYLAAQYPQWAVLECDTLSQAEGRVRSGAADCVITSAYQGQKYGGISGLYTTYLSKTVSMGFAALREETVLISVLNQTIRVLPESLMSGAMTMYANTPQTQSLGDFLRENALQIGLLATLLFLLAAGTLLLGLRNSREAEQKARRAEKKTAALNAQLQAGKQELETALAAAEHANAAKTVFLNSMSHDIRTPMNAIIGFTALAASHLDNPAAAGEYLKKIAVSGNHLLSLINDVLDMSRIESGKMVIEKKEVSLPEVLLNLRTIVQPNVTGKGQTFFIETRQLTCPRVITDRLRLNQILLNIVSNAIKFTPVGGTISLALSQQESALPHCVRLEFTVRDNGRGMSEEFQEHIFEAFSREQTATVSGIQGSGLGMAITKKIVDMLGGSIRVSSREGQGSVFTLTLDCKAAGSCPPPVLPESLENARILVVHHSTEVCTAVSRMLRELGMQPDWVTDGRDALLLNSNAHGNASPFRAYILDTGLTDVPWTELAAAFSGAERLILISEDCPGVQEAGWAAGATDLVQSPLYLPELARALLGEQAGPPEIPRRHYPDFTGKKLLLVEDNALNQEIALELLEEAGFRVEVANDGTVALEKLRSALPGQYDAVLMDIQMPIMDGYEATRQIRKLSERWKSRIPIVAMTANAFEEDRKAAFAAGMNGFVSKPIDLHDLLTALAEVLGTPC